MSDRQHRNVTTVAIVGCGIRGQLFGTALSQSPEAEVIAVADADIERARALASRIGATGYGTVEEMLDRHPGLDAAIIATPDFLHVDAAVACASRGLHLMIEKPLATDVASARRIADHAVANGAKVMVAFENRWNARFIEARRLIDAGALGRVSNLIGHLDDTVHVPTRMLSWAGRSSPGWFLMPHTLDLALWFTGAEPVRVYAQGTRGVLDARGIPTWDAITALFTLSDGSTVTLHSSWILPEGRPAVFDMRYEIQGSEGTLAVDGTGHGLTLYGQDNAAWPQLGVHAWRETLRGFPVDMVNDFVRFARGDEVTVPQVRDGLIVTDAIEAVHLSMERDAAIVISSSDRFGL